MRAYIHIGMPKTGTTSIQTWLAQNATALSGRGVFYDRLSMPERSWRKAHVELAICQADAMGQLVGNGAVRRLYKVQDEAAQREFAARYAEFFQAQVRARSEPVMVLSNEDLSAEDPSPEHAQALLEWVGRFVDEVHVIMYVRRQEDWLISKYSQILRRGLTLTLPRFLKRHATVDLHAMASMWAEAAGRDRFHLRLLERDAMVGGDLIADFAQILGVDPEGLAPPERQNESLKVDAAEFMRQFNGRLVAVHGGRDRRSNPLMKGVQQALDKICENSERLRLSQRQINHIREVNADSNERLRAEFFPDRDLLFPAKDAVGEAPAGPTAADMAQLGIDLLVLARTGGLPSVRSAEGLIRARGVPEGEDEVLDRPKAHRPGARAGAEAGAGPGKGSKAKAKAKRQARRRAAQQSD